MLPKFSRFFLILGTLLLFNRATVSKAIATEVELDLLCIKFPLNSRCQGYQADSASDKSSVTEYLLDRNDFCEEFAFNYRCQSEPMEIINLNLQDDEWIRIVKQDNRLQFAHSERTPDEFLALLTDNASDFIPLLDLFDLFSLSLLDLLPVDLNQYNWHDRQVTEVSFHSDCEASRRHRCPLDICLTSGTKAIDLPANTSFSQGVFTVKYEDGELLRSVTFRIPEDIEVYPVETVSILVPETARRSP